MLARAELVRADARTGGAIDPHLIAPLHDWAHSCAVAFTLSSPHSTTRACPLVRMLQLNSLPSDGSNQYFQASGSGCRASHSVSLHATPVSPPRGHLLWVLTG